MNRTIVWLTVLISVSAAGDVSSQESDRPQDRSYERGFGSQAPTSPVTAMIARQLRGRGISDQRVLQAMSSVPREKFVPKELQTSAYDDRPLPIGTDGKTENWTGQDPPVSDCYDCYLSELNKPGKPQV